jgi:DNA replication and repair protein RecF
MKVVTIQIHRFRNHQETALEFGSATNVFVGENGQGKTNIIEAISYLCLTRSFYVASDSIALQQGEAMFRLSGTLQAENGLSNTVRVTYENASNAKSYVVNDKEIQSYASVIGQFPLVVLSPENSAITFGGPADRRKFLDMVIAQSSKVYLDDLLEYRKALRQRNRLLMNASQSGDTGPAFREQLAPWTDTVVRYGVRIIVRRQEFFKEFSPYLTERYEQFVHNGETPSAHYVSTTGATEQEAAAIDEAFRKKMNVRYKDEVRLGTTLVGPHRDEIQFEINGLQLRSYASQGQHKSFLIALKLAEFSYLKERVQETPVLLLDDVFSELDEKRSALLVSQLRSMGQTFITTTTTAMLQERVPTDDFHRTFLVKAGTAQNIAGALA